ncbi:MAG: hypothetical protein K6A23_00315 [Butyrivibrio sp.]|nr:hypothetical protein [Butyrivibrio sp.]
MKSRAKSKAAAGALRAIPLLPNSLVLFGYNRLRKGISDKIIEEHYVNNSEKLKKIIEPDVFIENQHAEDWNEIKYGVNPFNKDSFPASYNVCGVIGVFNALISLGEHMDSNSMARLIRIFEKKGIAMGGMLGTTPRSVMSFFKQRGYKVKLFTSMSTEKTDAFGKEHETYIVMVMNNKKTLEDYMHIVNISVSDEGLRRYYYVHNGRDGKVLQFDSLSHAIAGINRKNSNMENRTLCIIGIDKK